VYRKKVATSKYDTACCNRIWDKNIEIFLIHVNHVSDTLEKLSGVHNGRLTGKKVFITCGCGIVIRYNPFIDMVAFIQYQNTNVSFSWLQNLIQIHLKPNYKLQKGNFGTFKVTYDVRIFIATSYGLF
jgi:hypothetical protein